MPAKKHNTTWSAAPHTIAKIRILQSYLYAYFQILGQTSPGASILYLDGFAGPGKYENFPDGSPVAALKAAVSARRDATQQGRWKAGAIKMAFIEADLKRFEHLQRAVDEAVLSLQTNSNEVECKVIHGEFAQELPTVKAWCPSPFRTRAPLFAFVDLFGAKGVPLTLVQEILASPCSEMLFNLNAYAVARVLKAKEDANYEEVLDAIFGTQGDNWHEVLNAEGSMEEICRDVLALYKRKLADMGMRYVFAFQMRKTDAALSYFLVFASKHRTGLVKMKEAMKQLDQNGGYEFVDASSRSGQQILFRFDNPEDFSRRFFDAYQGQKADYESLWDWALLDSPFVNPKEMLADLEKHGHIRVEAKLGFKRRRGSFPEEKIAFVEFSSSWSEIFKPSV